MLSIHRHLQISEIQSVKNMPLRHDEDPTP